MSYDGTPAIPDGTASFIPLRARRVVTFRKPMTYNPFWIEATASGLRAYFMPEDNKSTLYIYEADVK